MDLPGDQASILSRSALFAGLDAAFRARAVRDNRCRHLCAHCGEVIYSPDRFERSLGLVLSGQLEARRSTGREPGYLTSILGPGDLFGAAALFNDRDDYVATLVASAPSELLLFPQALVSDFIAENAAFAENYIGYLSGRIRFLSAKLDALAADGAERKLARYLLSLGGEVVTLPCAMSELPRRLGVSRASLYRAFDALAADGAAVRNGRIVRILRAEIVRNLCE